MSLKIQVQNGVPWISDIRYPYLIDMHGW